MLTLKDLKPRLYQETILHTATKYNTLAVLPTGLGKTVIALMLAIERLNSYPQSKVLFLAPTKPLVAQHKESFVKHLKMEPEKLVMLTGEIKPAKRAELWQQAKIVFSTPQGLSNDITNSIINLNDVSCLIIDEAHRCVKDYDYVWICKQYMQKSNYPRILGLTASPGSNKEHIIEVCKNAYIEEIEVRTHNDPDVQSYVQKVDIEYVAIELPEELKTIKKYLHDCFQQKLKALQQFGYLNHSNRVSRKELLDIQSDLHKRIAMGEKDFTLWRAISLNAEAIKVQHAIDLLETQGISALNKYLTKLFEEAEKTKTKATKKLAKDVNFRSAYFKTQHLAEEEIEHPKIEKLKEIVAEEIKLKVNCKIIVFNQYRDSASKLVNELNQVENVKAKLFVGQMKKNDTGLKQKEQIELLKEFKAGNFNCLVSSSVGEEGLDIPSVDLVVFYEPVPSAVRKIQRSGRTGRLEQGKVKILVTKNTVDEAYRWTSHYKERKMYSALSEIKKSLKLKNKQQTLSSFEKRTPLKIYADTREQSSGVIKELVNRNVSVKTQRLMTADYIISNIGIERKSVHDFVSSLIDKRILTQLKDLKQNFERPLLVIEGVEDIFSVRKVHPNAIRGMLAAIATSFQIPILYTKNPIDTAELLIAIAKREMTRSNEVQLRTDKKPLTSKEMQEYIVSSLPHIGSNLAKSLLKQFNSVKNIINADTKELQNVEKVGQKKAKDIKEIIERNYNG